ncbi:MAG: SRPBCC family protein, partial [Flavobacterium sp.]
KPKKALESVTAGTMLFRGISGYCPAYDAVSNSKKLKGGNVSITTSLSVDRPVSEVYQAWRQLENLPLFMKHLHSVMVIDEHKSEWKANLPAGIGTIGWKAEILMDEPNKLLSWHSMPGATINNAGKVKFVDNGSSTEIEVTISYHAPMGAAGEAAAKLLNPVFEKMIKNDIDSFKEYIEAGNQPRH